MKRELVADFCIPEEMVSVIQFGINNTVPNTSLSCKEAKAAVGCGSQRQTLLFFGNIAPYKGLEYLIEAFNELLKRDRSYRLLIVGGPKGSMDYWNEIRGTVDCSGCQDHVLAKIEHVPDETTELYFKGGRSLIASLYTRISEWRAISWI
jgi:glycosyltransferase involved in cell wall biosynthesis